LNCSESYFRAFKSTLQEKDKDFLTVIEEIERAIYNQKFQGAAGNLLNANIIARDLGLKEQTDITSGGESIKIPETFKILIDFDGHNANAPEAGASDVTVNKS